MAKEGIIAQLEMLVKIEKASAFQKEKQVYKIRKGVKLKAIAKGTPSSFGAAQGQVAFSLKKAKELKSQGKEVILIAFEKPEEIEEAIVNGLISGIVTQYGHEALHESVLARSQAVPLIDGMGDAEVKRGILQVGEYVLKEGDLIVIDASSGKIYLPQEENVLVEDRTVQVLDVVFDYKQEEVKVRKEYEFSSYQELLLEHARLINWLKHEKEITIESIRNNLSAHVIHEILFEKGSGLGKDKRKVNKDIVVSMKDNRSQDNKAIFDTENPVKPRRDFTEKTVVAEVTQINKSDRVNGSEMITKAEDVEMRRIVLETFNVFEEYPERSLIGYPPIPK